MLSVPPRGGREGVFNRIKFTVDVHAPILPTLPHPSFVHPPLCVIWFGGWATWGEVKLRAWGVKLRVIRVKLRAEGGQIVHSEGRHLTPMRAPFDHPNASFDPHLTPPHPPDRTLG